LAGKRGAGRIQPVKAARPLALAALGLLLTGCGDGPSRGPLAPAPAPSPVPAATPRPSFLVVVADDLDVATLERVPSLRGLLAAEGVWFTSAYVDHPLCAPSRASLLTGRYSHNHGVVANQRPQGGFPVFRARGNEAATLATWLHAAGYRTGLVGKYMNDYPGDAGGDYVPPGWDEWFAHITSYQDERYHGYFVNDGGAIAFYGNALEDYETDVLAERAVRFLEGAPERPFFLYVGLQAPHWPATYAERHAGFFPREGALRPPSFNEDDVSDKPAWVQNVPRLDERDERRLDDFQQARMRSLLAVEDLLRRCLDTLAASGRLDETYVLFTSDNGDTLGEHRLVDRKANFYEENARVPLVVRGRGVPRGVERSQLVLNLDLAPTLAELAGAVPAAEVDGRSLVPLLAASPPPASGWPQELLLEVYSSDFDRALRTPRYLYSELASGERELYDMQVDPYQTGSLHRSADPALVASLSSRLRALAGCRGAAECRGDPR